MKIINVDLFIMNYKIIWQDYKWWYQQQAPKYGYISSIYTAYFNARHFKRDGTYRKATYETQ